MAIYSYSSYEIQTVEEHIIKYFGNPVKKIPVKECKNLDFHLIYIIPT